MSTRVTLVNTGVALPPLRGTPGRLHSAPQIDAVWILPCGGAISSRMLHMTASALRAFGPLTPGTRSLHSGVS